MGSPWWAKKDMGAWSLPKGEYEKDEDPLKTARREFKEELGLDSPDGELIELGTIEQKNNKVVVAWAVQGDFDVSHTKSNTFTIEWPPHSGKMKEFPEIDRATWFSLEEASKKLIAEQVPFLERLANRLDAKFEPSQTQEQAKLF
jgi:predicted NUDIX family NTP pyrophosphohydrolase